MITEKEIQRQMIHIALGCTIVLLAPFIPYAGLFFVIVSLVALGIAYLVKKGYKIPLFYFLFTHFSRGKEREHFPAKGFISYIFGSGITILMFPDPIASAAIMILAFGDSISRLLGPYGAISHPLDNQKFVEGMLIGAIVAAFVASRYVALHIAIVGAIVGMFVEAWQLHILGERVDDNIIIPIVAAIVMFIF